VVYFKQLSGLIAATRLPAVKTVPRGKSRLFKLTKSGVGSPTFNWGYAYQKGTANPKMAEISYALPVAVGKQTKTLKLNSINESYGDGKNEEDFYAIGFRLEEGDTIFSVRAGQVISVDEDSQVKGENMTFSRSRNKIEVEHKDGTIASYSIFKANSAMVEVGDNLLAGMPIALAGGEQYNNGYQVRLSVYYLKFDEEARTYDRDFFSYGYQKIKFKTADEQPKELMPNIKYRGYIDEQMITQEMSKREKKPYNKSKSTF
jgi:hypothetical protein